MHKDEAVDIAYNAENMSLAELVLAYDKFHKIVENTPNYFADWTDIVEIAKNTHDTDELIKSDTPIQGKMYNWQRGLHGVIGLCTESAELLDAYKKELYGKNKPLREDNIREECGDVFFYLQLVMDAFGFTLRDILKDNVVKLANRYIDKFEV